MNKKLTLVQSVTQTLGRYSVELSEYRVKVGGENKNRTQILFLVLTGFYSLLLTGLFPKFKSLHTFNFGNNLCHFM